MLELKMDNFLDMEMKKYTYKYIFIDIICINDGIKIINYIYISKNGC